MTILFFAHRARFKRPDNRSLNVNSKIRSLRERIWSRNINSPSGFQKRNLNLILPKKWVFWSHCRALGHMYTDCGGPVAMANMQVAFLLCNLIVFIVMHTTLNKTWTLNLSIQRCKYKNVIYTCHGPLWI